MVRPSRNVDRALLASGAALYPRLGCAGLSVRAVAAHAGTSPGMFHYHFESKDDFVRELLQRFYDDLFEQIAPPAHEAGEPLARLRQVLLVLGRMLRQHAPVLRRVLADAGAGHAVAVQFLRRNMPRHLKLLLQLLAEAEAAGHIAPRPPLLRLTFLLGAVLAPVLLALLLKESGLLPTLARPQVGPQVLSDAAIAQRADLALQALTTGDFHA